VIFSIHPDIYYLGNGGFNNEHGWVDDRVAALLEVGLRYEPELQFDDQWALGVLGEHFDRFENMPDKKLLCLSSESMSFIMNYDIDPMLKASRLQRLFGENTRILIIIRNQLDLFRSYYFECVRGGYPGFFPEFLEFHYYYRFHSILTSMFYDKILLLYRHLFGDSSVMLLPMERLLQDAKQVQSELFSFMDVSPVDINFSMHNNSNDKRYIQAVRLLNERFPNNMGNTYFGMVDVEKIEPYWRVVMNEQKPAAAGRNYSDRMMIFRAAETVTRDFVENLQADYTGDWKMKLENMYRPHNTMLSELTGIDLSALGYPCD
jgi:hypothetical protein